MNKVLIIFFAILYLSKGYTGDGVGNGITKNNLVLSYENMSVFLGFVLEQSLKDFKEEEVHIIKKVLTALPLNKKNNQKLIFLSAQNYPDFFISNSSQNLLFKTQMKVGFPIYINTDWIFERYARTRRVISIAKGVSLLFQQLAFQHKITERDLLIKIGSKIETLLLKTHTQRFISRKRKISITYFNFNERGNSLLFLSDRLNVFDLTKRLREKNHCPQNSNPRTMELIQPYWTEERSPSWYLKGQIVFRCQSREIYNFRIVPYFYKLGEEILIKNIKFFVLKD